MEALNKIDELRGYTFDQLHHLWTEGSGITTSFMGIPEFQMLIEDDEFRPAAETLLGEGRHLLMGKESETLVLAGALLRIHFSDEELTKAAGQNGR